MNNLPFAICRLLLIFALLFFASCSKSQPPAAQPRTIEVGSINYDCDKFTSQIKTMPQSHSVRLAAIQVRQEALKEGNIILARTILDNIKDRDFLRLEEIVVRWRCEKKYPTK